MAKIYSSNICTCLGSRGERMLSSAPPLLLSQPPPPPGGQGSMEREERPTQHHPSPHRGVEGLRHTSSDQPCPPASPSGVAGWSSQRAGLQQVHSPLHCSPSRTAPTWADIVRGEDSTQQEAPAASPDDAIALYKQYVALGYQACFSVKSSAGYQEVSLFCRFPVLPAARCLSSHPHTNRRRQRQRNRQRNRSKPATRSTSAQTEPLTSTQPPRPHCPASPSPPAQAFSPIAPPPAKRTRKRRC
jgi:hypothetical protein